MNKKPDAIYKIPIDLKTKNPSIVKDGFLITYPYSGFRIQCPVLLEF